MFFFTSLLALHFRLTLVIKMAFDMFAINASFLQTFNAFECLTNIFKQAENADRKVKQFLAVCQRSHNSPEPCRIRSADRPPQQCKCYGDFNYTICFLPRTGQRTVKPQKLKTSRRRLALSYFLFILHQRSSI